MTTARRRFLLPLIVACFALSAFTITGLCMWFPDSEALNQSQNTETHDAQIHHVDFGEVSVQSLETQQFKVLNNTSQPWRISKINTGCACTSCDIVDRTVLPGEYLKGSLTIRTPRQSGPFNVIANVRFAGGHPGIAINASANVIEYVRADPREFVIDMSKGYAKAVKYQLTVRSKRRVSGPAIIKSNPPWCRVEENEQALRVKGSGRDGLEWHYHLIFSPERLPTARTGSSVIRVEIGKDEKFHVDIPVKLTLSEAITSAPDQIYFGRCRVEDSLTKTLVLNINDPSIVSESITVSTTSEIAEFTTVEMEPVSKSCLSIAISIKPRTLGPLRGNLLIRGPSGGILGTIPVFGLVDAQDSSVSLNGS